MMMGGEDPRYIARRLIRVASEDIGIFLCVHVLTTLIEFPVIVKTLVE